MSGLKTKLAAGIGILMMAGAAQAADTLRLGMTPEPYMPFTQISQAGVWEGLEADLSHAVCAKMGVTCEIKQMAWDGLIPSLNQDKVDFVIGAFSITDARRKVVDFSVPYYTEGTELVGEKGDTAKIALIDAPDGSGKIIDPQSVAGKLIGVQTSSVQAAYADKYLKTAEIKSYDTADNSVADLAAGRVDYVLGPDLFIGTFLKTDEGKDFDVKLEVPANSILGEGVAYAVRKGDTATLNKIDAAIDELKKDGTLQTFVDRWMNPKN